MSTYSKDDVLVSFTSTCSLLLSSTFTQVYLRLYGCECTYNVHCTYTLLARYSSYKCLKDSFITPREVESKLIIPSRYLILSVEQTITCSKDSFAPIHKIEQFPHSHVGANIKITYKIKMFPHRGPLYHTTILILCLVGSSAPLRLSSNQSAIYYTNVSRDQVPQCQICGPVLFC